MRLLNLQELESSSVVANCAMNRERRLLGSNSYERELDINILSFLRQRLMTAPVSWVDICCGTGRALIEAAAELLRDGEMGRFHIEGIDLAGLFDSNPFDGALTFREQGLESWEPAGDPYTLV